MFAEPNLILLGEKIRLWELLKEQAFLNAISGVTVAPSPTNPTPSPALVSAAAAQGVTPAQLAALTPPQLAQLQEMFDSGDL